MNNVKIVDIKGEIWGLLALAILLGMHLGYKMAKWANLDVLELGSTDAVFLAVLVMMIARGRALFRWIG